MTAGNSHACIIMKFPITKSRFKRNILQMLCSSRNADSHINVTRISFYWIIPFVIKLSLEQCLYDINVKLVHFCHFIVMYKCIIYGNKYDCISSNIPEKLSFIYVHHHNVNINFKKVIVERSWISSPLKVNTYVSPFLILTKNIIFSFNRDTHS